MTRSFIILCITIWVASSSAQYSEFDLNEFFRAFSNPSLHNLPPVGRGKGGRKLEIRTLCNAENPAYEIVEGVKVNAPFCIVKEVPFCNTIEECMSECSKEANCAALELNEGICTLYSVNYDNNPEKFEKSQIKGLHVVVQKRCTEDVGLGSNNNQIATELVPGYCLKGNPVKTVQVSSKNECVEKCLNNREFVCRSANYDRSRNICELNSVSRESLSKYNGVSTGSAGGSGGSGTSGSWSAGGSSGSGSSSPSKPGWSSSGAWNFTGSGMSGMIPGSRPQMSSGMFSGSGSHNSSFGSHTSSGSVSGSGSHTSGSGSHTGSGMFTGSGSHTSGSQTSSGSISGTGSHTSSSGSHTSSGSISGSGSYGPGSSSSGGQVQPELVKNENCLYIENNRVLEPNQVCTYETKENLIPYSFDAFYLDARTEDDCKRKCDNSRLG